MCIETRVTTSPLASQRSSSSRNHIFQQVNDEKKTICKNTILLLLLSAYPVIEEAAGRPSISFALKTRNTQTHMVFALFSISFLWSARVRCMCAHFHCYCCYCSTDSTFTFSLMFHFITCRTLHTPYISG